MVCGWPFAGKTTLERALLRRFDLARVDVDATKQDRFGPDVSESTLTHQDWVRIYAATDRRITDYLDAGRSVVDASRNFRRAERDWARAVARAHRAAAVTIFVDTPVEVVRSRHQANRVTPTRHDVADAEFEQLLRETERPAADERPLVLAHGVDLNAWIGAYLAPLLPES